MNENLPESNPKNPVAQDLKITSKFLNLSKTFITSKANNTYRFLQTPLGAGVAASVAASVATYLFSYTKLSQERDDALQKLKETEGLNDKLNNANIELTNAVNKLMNSNIELNGTYNKLMEKNLECKQNFIACTTSMEFIQTLHANSYFFKPNISHITVKYERSAETEKEDTMEDKKIISNTSSPK